ncbi:MAG: DUF6600 domain-containing protein [Mycobacteriaceae bacterium]
MSYRAMLAVAMGLSMVSGAHAQATDGIDPPARVGRLALLAGTVSFHTMDQDAWERATLNYPVTSGNALWTEPGARAAIDVGTAQVALDQSTEFDLTGLDDHVMAITQAQGAMFLRVRYVTQGDEYRITTPRGVVVIAQPGAYEIVAGDSVQPTMLTVVEGSARIDSPTASLTVNPRQVGVVQGSDTFNVSVGAAHFDPFLTARLAEEQQVKRVIAARVAPPPAVLQMSGGAALQRVGEWQPSTTYGRIWYPPVQASWVPYREGHWGYVAPWGWTWIDNSSWGFAPFHYGRWVQEGHRWGWIPVEPGHVERERAPPVYAPALVSFLNIGVAVTLGATRAPASVGWIPLGPREPYVPPYHASERYVRAVNVTSVTNVTNVTTINRVTTVNNFVNRRAATVVPGAVMERSQPVAARVERVDARVLAASHAQHEAPVRPTVATVGVTPIVARELKLAPAPVSAPGKPAPARKHAAPGPVLPSAPADATAAAVPGAAANAATHRVGTAALPALRPVTPPGRAHPPAGAPGAGKPKAGSPGVTPAANGPGVVAPDRPNAPAPDARLARPDAAAKPTATPVAPPAVTPSSPSVTPAPRAAGPKASEPKAAEPKVTEPKATDPKAPDLKAPNPKVSEPDANKPSAHGPRAREPHAPAPAPHARPAGSDAKAKPTATPVVPPVVPGHDTNFKPAPVSAPPTAGPHATPPTVTPPLPPATPAPRAAGPKASEPKAGKPGVIEPEPNEAKVHGPQTPAAPHDAGLGRHKPPQAKEPGKGGEPGPTQAQDDAPKTRQ